jgi:TrpR-related protein YerC/YecD
MNKKNPPMKNHEALYEAILRLENIDECRAFFEDICTIKELQDLSQRFLVAQMLSEGKNYQEICAATGASTATICRVNKCLTWGEGYRIVLDKAEQSTQGD